MIYRIVARGRYRQARGAYRIDPKVGDLRDTLSPTLDAFACPPAEKDYRVEILWDADGILDVVADVRAGDSDGILDRFDRDLLARTVAAAIVVGLLPSGIVAWSVDVDLVETVEVGP